MADPLSIASAVIGVAVATAQSTKALYQTVQSFRDQPRAVRQLQDELRSLDGVLDVARWQLAERCQTKGMWHLHETESCRGSPWIHRKALWGVLGWSEQEIEVLNAGMRVAARDSSVHPLFDVVVVTGQKPV
ncbi:hypothetical protein HYQ46_000228 [Verticillium longisporum]|nr:hypothetical protein HYQ46_000228 [Verticillium longisporum]